MQDKNKRIVLTGFMYCGKSTVGRKLARILDYDFIDLDTEIENKYHYTVVDIFKTFGENVFRNMEQQMLDCVLQKDNVVIACGGGTPCFFDNMKKIKDNSVSIYLSLNPASIYSRYANSKRSRPLLEGKSDEEIKQYITEKLKEREVFYNQSDIIITSLSVSPDEIAQKIKNFIP